MFNASSQHFEQNQYLPSDVYYYKSCTLRHPRCVFYLPDGSVVTLLNLISPEQLYILNVIFQRGLVNILCLWGICGNVITVLVLNKQSLKDTISILLTSIAVFDIVFCTTQLLQELLFILREYDPEAADQFLIIYMQGIVQWNHLALSSSIYIVAIIGIERLIAVCFPLLVARICTPQRTKWLIVITELFIFTFTFPAMFLFVDYKLRNGKVVATLSRLIAPETIHHALFYWSHLMPLVQVMLPLCVLLLCYVVIAVMLRVYFTKKSKLSSNHVTPSKTKELKVFRLLFTVMTVALISFLPPVVFSSVFSNTATFDISLDSVSSDLINLLIKVLSHIFPSANFIIYVTLSSKFASTYRGMMASVLGTRLCRRVQNVCSLCSVGCQRNVGCLRNVDCPENMGCPRNAGCLENVVCLRNDCFLEDVGCQRNVECHESVNFPENVGCQ